MKRTSLFALMLLSACAETPVSPSKITQDRPPEMMPSLAEGEPVHGLPVILLLEEYDGQVAYVCATQPRAYCHPDGGCQFETDHYVQLDRCPADPIP